MRTPGPMTMLVENRIDEKSLSLRNRLSVPDFPFATAMISPDSSMNGALVVTAGGGGGGGRDEQWFANVRCGGDSRGLRTHPSIRHLKNVHFILMR